MSTLEDLERMPEPERKKLYDLLLAQKASGLIPDKWIPNKGPQTDAYFCEADELFYGGSAGGGKSSLGNALAYNCHERSLILRRYNKDAKKLAEAELLGKILNGDRKKWNGTDLIFRDGVKSIEFAGCEYEEDKQRFKGDPHDLIFFDEITDFLESQYRFIKTWNRSSSGKRCRVFCTGNPPTDPSGLWVIQYWAPWLDEAHPNPAASGEIRWFITSSSGDKEVEGPGMWDDGTGSQVRARSRSFIRAKLSDNPFLGEDYASVLDALPEDIRKAYRDGQFDSGLKDNPWQMIPTSWVKAAVSRWKPHPPADRPMCAMGVDVAQGGSDNNIIAIRYDGWFDKMIVIPGSQTPLGTSIAGDVMMHRKGNAKVIIDCGGGYGGAPFNHLMGNGIECVAFKGNETAKHRTKDGLLKLNNQRTAAIWRLREALDPSQLGGSPISLPPDPEMISDLTVTQYTTKNGVIIAESKDEVKKRIGRSPDRGDAIAMAWHDGAKTATHYKNWQENVISNHGSNVRVLRGHANAKRYR